MEKYTNIIIKEAEKAYKKNEIPVGAIIVKNNKIISKAHNTRQRKHNVLGHAEINCIQKAEKKLKDWRLDDCDLYVTLEPCDMCLEIIKESRIKNVYYILEKNKKINNKNPNLKIINTKFIEKYKKYVNLYFKKLRNKY